MLLLLGVLVLSASAFGCDPTVDIADGDSSFHDGGSGDDGSSTSPSSGSTNPYGTPCNYLHGVVTLPAWDGAVDTYPDSVFSFEYGSKDLAIVRNDGDILYSENEFTVNMVVDDTSFIVDLGDIPLVDVPETVDPSLYPTGRFGDHDYIGVVVDHTFIIRTIDSETRQWAAARVTQLSPGASVTIEWLRGMDPEKLEVPTECL